MSRRGPRPERTTAPAGPGGRRGRRPAGALAAAWLLAAGCATLPAPAPEPLRSILGARSLGPVLARSEELRLQVVLGLLEPAGHGGGPRLRQFAYRAGSEYFYPASSIKLFAAVAALEELASIRRTSGSPLGVDTPLAFHPLFEGESLETADPSNVDGGAITVRQEIRKLFLVSDNEAFNRLYELAGPDRLAACLARVGLGADRVRIVHRLAEPRSAEENLRTPRIDFLLPDGGRHVLPERRADPLPPPPPLPGLLTGRAFLRGDEIVHRPLDFADKNRMPLADLQRGLCKVVRPDADCGGGPSFSLSEADRALLLEAMTQWPRESANPVYPAAEFPDEHVKYALPGVRRVLAGDRLRVLDKVGQAYGFTTENAWIVDTTTGRGFFLAATLYTNADQVLNDDRYEYDQLAEPFLADLGEAAARWYFSGSGQPKKK